VLFFVATVQLTVRFIQLKSDYAVIAGERRQWTGSLMKVSEDII
jgi:hypothetical protein